MAGSCDLLSVAVTAGAGKGLHAILGTGGFLGHGCGVAVAGGFHCLVGGVVTGRAVLVCFVTSFLTGRCLGLNLSQGMAGSCDLLSVAVTTGAGEGLYTFTLTAGCSGFHAVIVAVAQCGNRRTAFGMVTPGTAHNCSLTVCGTSGSNCLVFNISHVMTQSINSFLSNQDCVTYEAMLAFGQAGFGTGRSNSLVDNLGVAQSGNLVGLVGIAACGAGVGGVAFFSAGGRCYLAVIAVAQGCPFSCAAGLTGLGSGAGCSVPVVAGCGDLHFLGLGCGPVSFGGEGCGVGGGALLGAGGVVGCAGDGCGCLLFAALSGVLGTQAGCGAGRIVSGPDIAGLAPCMAGGIDILHISGLRCCSLHGEGCRVFGPTLYRAGRCISLTTLSLYRFGLRSVGSIVDTSAGCCTAAVVIGPGVGYLPRVAKLSDIRFILALINSPLSAKICGVGGGAHSLTGCRSLHRASNGCLCSTLSSGTTSFGVGTGPGSCTGGGTRPGIGDLAPVVAGGRNGVLRHQGFTAGFTMGTLGQTGGSTGSSNSCVGHFSVTQGVDHFLSSQDCVTYGAVLAFGLTRCGTGSRNSCVDHFGVARGWNLLSVAVSTVNRILTDEGLHTCFGTGSRFGNNLGVFVGTCSFCPGAVFVGIGASDCGTGANIGVIRIYQLSRGDGDLGIACTLNQLVSFSLGTWIDHYNRAINAANICAARGCVQIAFRTVYSTRYDNFCIYQIFLCTGILLTRSIVDREQFFIYGTAIIAPLIGIIHIEVNTFIQANSCTAVNLHNSTWQQDKILTN